MLCVVSADLGEGLRVAPSAADEFGMAPLGGVKESGKGAESGYFSSQPSSGVRKLRFPLIFSKFNRRASVPQWAAFYIRSSLGWLPFPARIWPVRSLNSRKGTGFCGRGCWPRSKPYETASPIASARADLLRFAQISRRTTLVAFLVKRTCWQ